MVFGSTTSSLKRLIGIVEKNASMKEAVDSTEAYVREEIGDARSFSLDSPKSRNPRLVALRALK
jgi:hypothetical protein